MRIQESGAGLTGLGISVTKVCECMRGVMIFYFIMYFYFFIIIIIFCELNMYFELFLWYCYILSLRYTMRDCFRSIV